MHESIAGAAVRITPIAFVTLAFALLLAESE